MSAKKTAKPERRKVSKTVYYEVGDILLEWNSRKADQNREKHGIAFNDAARVFLDRLAVTLFDETHSTDEDRYVTIGEVGNGLMVVVFHTDRNDRIRIISARKPTAREREDYEQGT